MSVTGVYMPCLDQGIDVYRKHLVILEQVITESESVGPVVIVSDFNAHLG